METAYGETISPHDVVIANGEIGAVMIAWVGHGKVGEELLVTGRAVDLAVHPKHQGKRYARLINFPSTVRNEYREDYFGFDTRPNAAPVLHMHDNETVARGVRVWTRPFGVLRTVAGVRHALGQRVVTTQLVDTLSHRHAPRRSTARRIQVEPVARFDERADALWERAGAGFDVVRVRDAQTLNWRYLDPRAGQIVTLGAFEGDSLLGYLAYRRPAEGVALILDVLVEPDRPAVVTALTRRALRLIEVGGATRVDAWLAPGHPYEAAFEAGGLFDSGTMTNVEFGTKMIRHSATARAMINDPATTLHVTMGDFDWV